MTDDKTPAKPKASPKISVSSPDEEPKQASAEPAGAKPTTAPIARDAVVSGGETDPIFYSKAKVPGPTEGRKSLTVLHIQRRLAALGFTEAASSPGGRFDALTTSAVRRYQETLGDEVTGVLTRDQFEGLFKDDPNVTVTQDTSFDHSV